MDHETALEAANQALTGSSLRSSSRGSSSRIASIELQRADPMRRGGRALPSLDYRPPSSSEAWQVAAVVVVTVATLLFVVTLWLL